MLGAKPTDKVLLGGKKFLDGYDFLIDICVDELSINPTDDPKKQRFEYDYGVLEVGYSTEELAEAAYQKSNAKLKEIKGVIFHPTPYLTPNACCFRVGKSLIFFYTVHGDGLKEYLPKIKTWQDESKRPKFD